MFFCGCTSNSQDSPKASPRAIVNGDFSKMQGRASGRKGERKTYCMYTAIHIISATDLPNKHSCAQARAGGAPGAQIGAFHQVRDEDKNMFETTTHVEISWIYSLEDQRLEPTTITQMKRKEHDLNQTSMMMCKMLI